MKTKQEILDALPNFYGTEAYHQWSPLFRNFVLTDGAKYIAEECGAYWLMDAIASHFPSYRDEEFAVVELMKFDSGWNLQIEDGNGDTLAEQFIEFSDFPLDEITFYVVPQELEYGKSLRVILLTSEY